MFIGLELINVGINVFQVGVFSVFVFEGWISLYLVRLFMGIN